MVKEHWHLDKKVPIGIILGLVLQSMAFIYVGTSWKDGIDNRITALEKSDSGQANHENRLTVLEQQFNYIRGDLSEIKDLLRRQIPDQPQQ